MTDDFYLTLPSNAGQNVSASSFRVNLPQSVRLYGEWEVALSEIIYPYSWYNVNSLESYSIWYKTAPPLLVGSVTRKFDCATPGHYSEVEDLFRVFEDTLPSEYKKHIVFAYNKRTNRVNIQVAGPVKAIYLPNTVLYMLGYDVEKSSNGIDKTNGLAPHSPDMTAGIHVLYVYCDIAEHTVVGDKLAPLLRAVAVEGKFGDIINKIFISPHYVPVLKKDFSSVEIEIKTDQNQPLALRYGKTLVKLHFRRKQKSLFTL